MKKTLITYLLHVSVAFGALAQVPAPAPAQSGPIAIMNATAHLGNGEVIENSIITFDKGKITMVSDARTVRVDLSGYKQINASGKHVYPGLILPSTHLGLVEIDAVRATRDFDEAGSLNPNVRAAVAYNTDSELIPTMKFTGIQLAQTTPSGGLISGTSSVMQLDAWNWEDALYKSDDGIHLNWPSLTTGPRWWMGETERKENKDYKKEVDEVIQLFKDTKSYTETAPEVKNLRLEAMAPVLTGEKQVYVHVDRAPEMVEAIRTLKALGIPKIVLVGADDAWYVKDLIKMYNIPVLVDDVHRLPGRDDEDYDLPYRLPAMLQEEGILVGLTYVSGSIGSNRNLPFFAGTVAGYGNISKEEALKMVTSNTARILGVADKTGTIEEGKDANLVITGGDLLDMKGNLIEYSFIQGRQVDLEALQQRLYEKFKMKYEREMK